MMSIKKYVVVSFSYSRPAICGSSRGWEYYKDLTKNKKREYFGSKEEAKKSLAHKDCVIIELHNIRKL